MHDHIAELISDVHTSYGLSVDKISAAVTDNASNFGRAFREYMIDIHNDNSDDTNEQLLTNDNGDNGDVVDVVKFC